MLHIFLYYWCVNRAFTTHYLLCVFFQVWPIDSQMSRTLCIQATVWNMRSQDLSHNKDYESLGLNQNNQTSCAAEEISGASWFQIPRSHYVLPSTNRGPYSIQKCVLRKNHVVHKAYTNNPEMEYLFLGDALRLHAFPINQINLRLTGKLNLQGIF